MLPKPIHLHTACTTESPARSPLATAHRSIESDRWKKRKKWKISRRAGPSEDRLSGQELIPKNGCFDRFSAPTVEHQAHTHTHAGHAVKVAPRHVIGHDQSKARSPRLLSEEMVQKVSTPPTTGWSFFWSGRRVNDQTVLETKPKTLCPKHSAFRWRLVGTVAPKGIHDSGGIKLPRTQC